MINHQKIYKLKPDVVFQPMDENAIIVSLNSEEIYKLNETGTKVVDLITKEMSVREILTVLEATYEIDTNKLQKEITHLLEELFAAGLIEDV